MRLNSIIAGKGTDSAYLVAKRFDDAKKLLNSEENRLLLTCSV
jgi:hypothetical protein